jgi:PST family polysaccharide transporter
MAMAVVFTGFATTLSDAGFGSALVQRKAITDSHCNAVFWLNAGCSFALAGGTYALAPYLARFYTAPALTAIFRFIALNFVFAGLGSVHGALLQKEMKFRELAHVGNIAQFASGAVGVAMAFSGAGVWSLVAQMLCQSMTIAFLRWKFCAWRPKIEFHTGVLREMWRFSGHLYVFNILNYWSRNGDNLLIGKYFGEAALGLYSRAYTLMLLPITQINGVISQVAFPAFALIQDDKQQVKRLYLRGVRLASFVTFPFMVGLIVTAKPFIFALLGPKWGASVPLLQILAIAGLMQVIGNTVGWLFMSQGRTDVMLAWGVAYSVSAILSFAVGVYFGSVLAVAVAYAVVNGIFFYPEVRSAANLVGMKGTEVLRAIKGAFVCSLAMGAAVFALGAVVPRDWLAWERLLILSGFGFLCYTGLAMLFHLGAWSDMINLARKKMPFQSRPMETLANDPRNV